MDIFAWDYKPKKGHKGYLFGPSFMYINADN